MVSKYFDVPIRELFVEEYGGTEGGKQKLALLIPEPVAFHEPDGESPPDDIRARLSKRVKKELEKKLDGED